MEEPLKTKLMEETILTLCTHCGPMILHDFCSAKTLDICKGILLKVITDFFKITLVWNNGMENSNRSGISIYIYVGNSYYKATSTCMRQGPSPVL